MERIEVRTSTSGTDELVLVYADAYIDGLPESQRVAKLRGELSRDRVLHVGYIETEPRCRRTGAATRLLLHTFEVLAVARVTAETVDDSVDEMFAKAAALAGIEAETD